MSLIDLSVRSVLVTGSTAGIGLGIADGLVESGARVIQHGRSPQPPEAARSHGYVSGNLVASGAAQRLIEDAEKQTGGLDLLVCNAGSFFDVGYLEMDEARVTKTFDLNVRSTFFLVQTYAKLRIAAGKPGSVVLIGSTNSYFAEDNSVAYDASKGAIAMLTKSMAHTLAKHRIRVNCVAPGLIRTPLTAGWMDAQPDTVKHYEKKILLGRIGMPVDCAGPTAFFLSEASAYVTGEVMIVDGGLTVGQIGKM